MEIFALMKMHFGHCHRKIKLGVDRMGIGETRVDEIDKMRIDEMRK